MPEGQTDSQPFIQLPIPQNEPVQIKPESRVEQDEDGIKYDRNTVNKIKKNLVVSENYVAANNVLLGNFSTAFNLLEISQCQNMGDVIDKMNSSNYDHDSLELKANSLARAIYEIGQKTPGFQKDVISGPYSIENRLLGGSPELKGIGEKVFDFVTKDPILSYVQSYVDDQIEGFGKGIKYTASSIKEMLSKAADMVASHQVDGFKNEKAKTDILNSIYEKMSKYTKPSQQEKNEKFFSEKESELVKNNYQQAVELVEEILSPEKSEQKTVIPFSVHIEKSDPDNERSEYTVFNSSFHDSEGKNQTISLSISRKNTINLTTPNGKNSFSIVDTRGAVEEFIGAYKKANTHN